MCVQNNKTIKTQPIKHSRKKNQRLKKKEKRKEEREYRKEKMLKNFKKEKNKKEKKETRRRGDTRTGSEISGGAIITVSITPRIALQKESAFISSENMFGQHSSNLFWS